MSTSERQPSQELSASRGALTGFSHPDKIVVVFSDVSNDVPATNVQGLLGVLTGQLGLSDAK